MNHTIRQRAAKGGKAKTVQLDEAGIVRLAYCERVALEHLKVNVSFSTIVRRSLILYQGHCEALVRGDIGKPGDAALYRRIEAAQLRMANKGSESPNVSVEMVRESLALLTVGELSKEVTSKKPTINDLIKHDLERRLRAKPEPSNE